MFKCYGLLILVIGAVLVLHAGFSRAWMVGKFQVPAPKVRPQPVVSRPAAAASSGVVVSLARARAGETFTDSVTGMEFVWVKGGCFQMGSPSGESKRYEDEGPVHRVCVDGFWMGKYEVPQGQWQKLMGNNPSRFKKGDNYPVETVSWNDCQEFIKKLNYRSNKTFRLPTEAEWEYACRAGTTTARFWGAAEGSACSYANVNDLTSKRENKFSWDNFSCDDGYAVTAPVGSFKANHFGLYDMLGNVWEWCADRYGKNYYANSPERNPQGPSSGSYRVNRGGSWSRNPRIVRSAGRSRSGPGDRGSGLGFRLVFPGR